MEHVRLDPARHESDVINAVVTGWMGSTGGLRIAPTEAQDEDDAAATQAVCWLRHRSEMPSWEHTQLNMNPAVSVLRHAQAGPGRLLNQSHIGRRCCMQQVGALTREAK